ncbi:MAG: flavoprotein, partial [Sporomusa sp.]
VLVPVLTQNTAAKLAHTFTDTMAASLIVQALMLGKPVIAAQNAADPEDDWRLQKNMNQAPPPLREAMQENLRKCKLYGIELVPVNTLAAAAKKVILREADPQPVFSPGETAKKQVLDADTVRHSARNGARTVSIAQGTLVTPLARDIAVECGVDIVYK